jgi:hypothetical protein
VDLQAALAQMDEKLPGMVAYLELDNPGMHATDTVDFGVVLSGEVILELDDGVEKVLPQAAPWCRTGRATVGNRGIQPAVLAVFLIGPTAPASDPGVRQLPLPQTQPAAANARRGKGHTQPRELAQPRRNVMVLVRPI